MADPITLAALLLAGAQAVGEAAVQEATKDAYGKLKDVVTSLFGPRAAKAATKLEDAKTREEGRSELARYVPETFDADEAMELQPAVAEMIKVLRADPAAREVAYSRIGLDLDVGGDALLRDIHGAREIAVKAKTKGNFTLEGVRMDPDKKQGN